MKKGIRQGNAKASRSVVLGTAGHIDHGKTSLVLALTGTDTDRLPEEKARGITVDLGFASMKLADDAGPPLEISIVDVPGHHAFIRNMLAGTGGINCVMLIVAANEGVKPQTVEHLAICKLLGIRYGLTVLTKCDLISAERMQQVRAEVQRFVQGTFLANAAIVSLSVRTGEGVDALKQALVDVASKITPPENDAVLRLPLDRAFTVRGIGAVVTGTLRSGSVQVGETLELQPAGREVRVRGLQIHGSTASEAQAPTRIALALSGIEVSGLHRGQMLTPPHALMPVSTVDVELQTLPGVPLPKHRSRVRLHTFTAEVIATILLFQQPVSPSEGTALARLKLREPLLLLPGDRFILRRLSPAETLGGGRVIDAHPQPRQRKAATFSWLERLRTASREDHILARVARRGTRGVSFGELIAETGLTHNALQAMAAPLVSSGQLLAAEENDSGFSHLVSGDSVDSACEQSFMHVVHDTEQQLSRAELQSRIGLPPWVFRIVWKKLSQDVRLQASGSQVRLKAANTAGDDAHLARLETLYRKAGLASPILSEAAAALGLPLKSLPSLITQLIRRGKLLRMGSDDLLIHSDAVVDLQRKLKQHPGEKFDVAWFKAFTGLSRKHAIPLLEYLDRLRIVRNEKGIRTVL